MEVLKSLHALQRPAVSEPNQVVSRDTASSAAKVLLHEVLNVGMGFGSKITGDHILFEVEFGPDDNMNDVEVDAVGPVIVEDLVVSRVAEWRSAGGLERCPVQSLFLNEVDDRSESAVEVVSELDISSEVVGSPLEEVNSIDSCDVS